MKKKFCVVTTLLFVTVMAYAADFTPLVMTITSPAQIEYQFDGATLTIPFTLANTPAAVWLVINTKGQAANIVGVRNGYLGWHYVNKTDTTIYISGRYSRTAGETSVTWDGKDENGNAAAAGSYDYYLWGYDDQTARQIASQFVQIGFNWESQFTFVIEKGEDGLPLSKPMLFASNVWWQAGTGPFQHPHGTTMKWELGGDPMDINHLQTTWMPIFSAVAADAGISYGGPCLNPTDYDIFYNCVVNFVQLTDTFMKWQFVTDGEAIRDENWLGWDELTMEDKGCAIGVWSQKPTVYTDGNYIYGQSPGLHQKQEEWNKLRCVSFEGDLVFDKMMHDWYMPDDNNPHDYINGAFHLMASRVPYHWFLVSHTSCLHQMINTTRLVVDPDDESDMVIFTNSNGDYWMDSADEPNIEPAWHCLADTKTSAMRRESNAIDRNGFNIIGTGYYGLISFGVSTQDGTGIGYMSFGDDTISDERGINGGVQLCDSGSSYDGLYVSGALTADSGDWTLGSKSAAWYVASDSSHGIITNQPVAVEDESPAAFIVEQNSPNPFNPTTSIAFMVPAESHVIVDIYNVAGQKVDALVNGMMNAGRHSVVWDATGFSNGVYFYTVKSGDFTKTMKMTLLK